MSERSITTKTIKLGPDAVKIVRNFMGSHLIYLDIGGSTFQVLGILSTSNECVVDSAPVAASNRYRGTKVITNDLYYGKQVDVHCVVPTFTRTRELTAAEVGA